MIKKKKVMLMIIGLIIFIMPLMVNAEDVCKKFHCITCSIRIDSNFDGIWTVKSNGDGTGTVDYETKQLKDKGPHNVQQNFVFANFLSKDEKKLKCPNIIYRYYESAGTTTRVFLSTKQFGSYSKANTVVEVVYDNKKPVKDSKIKTRSCQYQASETSTAAGNSGSSVIATVTRAGDTITYSFTDGYQENTNFPKIDKELISFDKSKACPKLYVYCGSDGAKSKFCSIQTEPNFEDEAHNAPGKEGQDAVNVDRLIEYKNEATLDGLNQKIGCEVLFASKEEGSVFWIIQRILLYIRIAGPILVVLLSAVDFIKVVLSSEDDSMKKAQKKFMIRLIGALALFLIPLLVSFLLQLIGNIEVCTP